MNSFKKMKVYLCIMFLGLMSLPSILGYSASSGLWYFKEFFKKIQPKEYYQFLGGLREEYEPSKKIAQFYYEVIDDFKIADQWTISFGPEMASIENTFSQAGSDPKETYIHWKTLDPMQEAYPNAATPTLDSFKKNPTNTSILGVRALFINNLYQRIMLTPKNKLLLKKAQDYFRLEMFVFGIGKDYDLFITIKTTFGNLKKIYLGNLNYFGWKHLSRDLKDYGITSPPMADFPLNRRIEIKNILLESRTTFTEGFFGTWLSTLRYSYRVPQVEGSGLALYGQFAWQGTAPSQGIQENALNSVQMTDTEPSTEALNRPNNNTTNN